MGRVTIGSICYKLIEDVAYNDGILYLFDKSGKLILERKIDDIAVVLSKGCTVDIAQSNTWVNSFDSRVYSVCADMIVSYDSVVQNMKGNISATVKERKNIEKAQMPIETGISLCESFHSVSVISEVCNDPLFRLCAVQARVNTCLDCNLYLFKSNVRDVVCNKFVLSSSL